MDQAGRHERFWRITPDPAIIVDNATDRIVEVNPAWFGLFGWAPEEVIGRPFTDFVHPEDLIRSTDLHARVVGGTAFHTFENRIAVKGGGYRRLEWNGLADGGLSFGFARDITERHAQQREYDRQKQLTERMIDAAPVAMSYLNRDLIYEWANAYHSGSLGLRPDQIVGKSLLEAYGPVGAAAVAPLLQGVLDSGKPHHATSFPFESEADGRVYKTYWDFTYLPVFEDGEVVGVMPLAQEVSDRVARDELQRQRIADLEAANVHKEQFLGILSHELRTPLNAIEGFGSVLEDEIAGPLNERQAGFVGKILGASSHMLTLIDDLLDLSRLQAGRFQLVRSEVRLTPVLREVLAEQAGSAIAKGLSLVSYLPAPGVLPPVVADLQRVRQIILNLVSNAIKYTDEGGMITVDAAVAGDRITVKVTDTGIGIAPEQQARVFEPFTQVDMSNTRKVGGVGLGLSIVKALVDAHGGEVGVESVPGKGSTFWFALPLSDPA